MPPESMEVSQPTKYIICNIRYRTDKCRIYGELRTLDGELIIGATLDYIMEQCVERGYMVTNFSKASLNGNVYVLS